MTSSLPTRPSVEVVEEALRRCSWNNETSRENVLASELLHLRETIERCRSVQRVNAEAAKEWAAEKLVEPEAVGVRTRALIYREVADELEKALR